MKIVIAIFSLVLVSCNSKKCSCYQSHYSKQAQWNGTSMQVISVHQYDSESVSDDCKNDGKVVETSTNEYYVIECK